MKMLLVITLKDHNLMVYHLLFNSPHIFHSNITADKKLEELLLATATTELGLVPHQPSVQAQTQQNTMRERRENLWSNNEANNLFIIQWHQT